MGKAVPKKPSPDGNTEQTQPSDFHPPQQPPPQQQQQFYSFQQTHHQEMPGAHFPQAAQEAVSQPQQQLPRQILLQPNQQIQNFQPPQQQQQCHGGFVDQEIFEPQLLESFLDSMGTMQPQGKQHQQQYLPQQQQQLQDQSQQPQQHLMMQTYPSLPHNQSFDPATPNMPVSTQLPGYQLMTSGMGRTGGSISLSPAKLGYGLGLRDEGQPMLTLPSDTTSLEPHCGKRQRLDPPVAAYPERGRLDRGSQFNVDIPGTGPKLLVNQDEDGEGRRINTEMGHMITLELTHNVFPSCANFRFLLVYSKDAEASTPVEPCLNHRRQEHPKHMLEVKAGEREASISWEDDPHPSVLVKPTNQAPGRFTCQLAFLCRNSCVTRRDLTLLCQLEVGGRVMGREPFKVKVSACPRRDAGAPTRRCTSNTAPRGQSGTTALSSSSSCMFPHPQQVLPPDPERVLAADEIAREALGEADKIGKAMFVERYVKQNYPEKYEEAEKVYEHCQRTNGKHM